MRSIASTDRLRAIGVGLALVALSACGPPDGPAPAAEEAAAGGVDGAAAAEQTIQPLPIATRQSGAVVASQGAAVSQNLGQAQITIVYNRPVARGRVIFGNLVPFDEVWHPGADQASYLRTTEDIFVAGELLPAGSYSFWMTPGREEWEVVLHRDWDVFHLPFPGEEGVALRFSVEPRHDAGHMESMAFHFPVADRRTGLLAFHWADTRLDIPIEVPGPDDAP